ncbi:MAG: hypothetical protein WC471_00445 [Candidatus Woesearchaeota archaeon]
MTNKYITGKRKIEQTLEKSCGRPTSDQADFRDKGYIKLGYSNPLKKVNKIIKNN